MKLNVYALCILALIAGLSLMITMEGEGTGCNREATCAGVGNNPCADKPCKPSGSFGSKNQTWGTYSCCGSANLVEDCRTNVWAIQTCAHHNEYSDRDCQNLKSQTPIFIYDTVSTTCM